MVRSVETIAVWCVVYIYVGTFDFNAKRKPMLSIEKHCHDSHGYNYALPALRLRQFRQHRTHWNSHSVELGSESLVPEPNGLPVALT
jgi:hypothetical protein